MLGAGIDADWSTSLHGGSDLYSLNSFLRFIGDPTQ